MEKRVNIKFCFKLDKSAAEISSILQQVYDVEAMELNAMFQVAQVVQKAQQSCSSDKSMLVILLYCIMTSYFDNPGWLRQLKCKPIANNYPDFANRDKAFNSSWIADLISLPTSNFLYSTVLGYKIWYNILTFIYCFFIL